jgi:hypothetical protein
MLKKLTAPYKHAPAIVSMDRIDAALAAGAQAEIQSPGRGGYKSTSLVTLKTPDGRLVDSWTVQGNVISAHKFVASYNRKLATLPPLAPPPAQGWPPQQQPTRAGQPQYPYQQQLPPVFPPGYQGQPDQQGHYPPPRQEPPDTTGWTKPMPRRPGED